MSKKVSPKSKSVTVNLEYPFEWPTENGKEEVKSITLGRPKGKHLKNIGKDVGMHDMFQIAAKICEEDFVTPAFFDEMDASDCMTVVEVIGDFLDNGRGTGKTA